MKKILLFALPLLAMLSVSCEKKSIQGTDEITGIGIPEDNGYERYYSKYVSEVHDAVGNLSNSYDIYYWYVNTSNPNYYQNLKNPSNTWSVSCNADWCHYEYEELIYDYYGTPIKYLSLSYELDNNDTGEERSTTIKVQNGTATCEIHITQNGYSIVNVTTPGTLVDKLAEQDLLYAETLKITGELNETDLNTIKGLKNAAVLDLSEIIIDDLPDRMFNYNSTIRTVSLPKSITTIHSETFSNSSIETVIIPANIERIEDGEYDRSSSYWKSAGAFSRSNLTNVKFDKGSKLSYIGIAAFCGCQYLEDITIPKSVKTIADYAFHYDSNTSSDDLDYWQWLEPAKFYMYFEENSALTNLGSINLDSDCTIDASNCEQIQQVGSSSASLVKIGTRVPPTVNGYGSFSGGTLEVPKGCLSAYYQSEDWNFDKIVEME